MSTRYRRLFIGRLECGYLAVVAVVMKQAQMSIGLVWRTTYEVYWPARASPEDVSRN